MSLIMFFILSKIIGFLIKPLHVLLILMAGAAGLRYARSRASRKRAKLVHRLHRIVTAVLVLWIANLLMPILPYMAVHQLEHRFPIPDQHSLNPDMIVILGGWQGAPSAMRDETTPSISSGGDRLITGLILAERYPNAKIAFPGGLKRAGDKASEADITEAVIQGLNLDRNRLIVEGMSRNTAENAAYLNELIDGEAAQIVLITSAWHMPRAIGSFRAAGLNPIPYPTDFSTPKDGVSFMKLLGKGLGLTQTALSEYIGLIAYRLTGRTDRLLPQPN